jgi:hypothetical protein
MTQRLYCGFCGKSQHEVAKLLAGPTVHICSECVDLCHDIMHPRPTEPPPPRPEFAACKDCRWAKEERHSHDWRPVWVCLHANSIFTPEPDYVTGEIHKPEHTHCAGMRAGICGKDGKFWEPREWSGVIGFGEALCLENDEEDR